MIPWPYWWLADQLVFNLILFGVLSWALHKEHHSIKISDEEVFEVNWPE